MVNGYAFIIIVYRAEIEVGYTICRTIVGQLTCLAAVEKHYKSVYFKLISTFNFSTARHCSPRGISKCCLWRTISDYMNRNWLIDWPIDWLIDRSIIIYSQIIFEAMIAWRSVIFAQQQPRSKSCTQTAVIEFNAEDIELRIKKENATAEPGGGGAGWAQ